MLTRSRRLLAAVLALATGVVGLTVAASPVAATPGLDFERLAGPTRWATAVEVAKAAFTDGADTVVLANGVNLADALVANHLAGALDAPILLSLADDIPDATVDGLADLGVTRAYLVGGTAQLGQEVLDELDDLGIEVVDQVAGTDRFDTAQRIASVAADLRPIGQIDGDRIAFVTTGASGSTDALVAGPISYAEGFPILLSLPAAVGDLGGDARAALQSLQIEHVVVIGGTGAVPDTVRTEIQDLGITTERISGLTRFETASELATFAIEEVGFRTDHVNIATGVGLPDAIAGGPHAGVEQAPILLGGNVVPQSTCDALGAQSDTLSTGHIFGGGSAIALPDELALEECGGATPTNQSFIVAPSDAGDVLVADTRSYTVSELGDAAAVDIAVVDCALVSASSQVFTFADAEEPADRADGFGEDVTAAATITEAGGTFTDADLVSDVAVEDGTVSFELTADEPGCVRPVVFVDGDEDDALELDASDQPTEPFAVGGETVISVVDGVVASAPSALRPFGASTTISAQLTGGDPATATAAAGQQVLFIAQEVVVGQAPPQFGQDGCGAMDPSVSREDVATVVATTDLNGVASFTLAGADDPAAGEENEVARCVTAVVDTNANGSVDDDEPTSAELEVRFSDAAPVVDAVTVEVTARTRFADTDARVTVTVLDQFGDGVPAAEPTLELYRDGATSSSLREVLITDDDGTATILATGPGLAADDIYVACMENPDDADEDDTDADNNSCDVVGGDGTADAPNARADLAWITIQTSSTTVAHDSCVLVASAAGQFVEIGEAGSSRNLRVHYDGDDSFSVVTAQGPQASSADVLLSDFASRLTAGDRIRVAYTPDGASAWSLVEDTNCTLNSQTLPPEASTAGTVPPPF